VWQRLLEEVRQAGPRKIALLILAAAIAILLAFGANSSDDAANGRTLPRASHNARLYAPAAAQHP
jgi:tetrahydromethanopterin S-methyltransferase subunit C